MIRPYQPEDTESIIEAWYQASLIAHSFLTAEFFEHEKVMLREKFLPNAQTWVDERNGQVAGFLSMAGNVVGGLFVHPNWQRQGVGHALMDKAASLHAVLELDVFEANQQGRAFYAKYGFLPTGRLEDETTGQMLIKLRYDRPSHDG